MSLLLNAADYRARARKRLPKLLFEYIDRGTEDERALRRLRQSLDDIELVPSVLTGAVVPDLTTSILGRSCGLPLVVAPTALAGLVSYDGEAKLARAASRLGIPVCISTQSTTTIEQVRAGAPDAEIWFQLYVWKNRNLTRQLLERVAAAGATTLVVTADTPASPKREYNLRNGFSVPWTYSPRTTLDVMGHPRWAVGVLLRYLLTTGMPSYGHYPEAFRSSVTRAQMNADVQLENRLSWDDVRDIRRWWVGKLVVKGVLSIADAQMARAVGAEAIVVSAHGARNLDVAPPPARVLGPIADALTGQLEIFADSGVARGGDVLRYMALGASAVMVGRLPLWGLAAAGEPGAAAILAMLRDEMQLTLTMLGLQRPSECRTALMEPAT